MDDNVGIRRAALIEMHLEEYLSAVIPDEVKLKREIDESHEPNLTVQRQLRRQIFDLGETYPPGQDKTYYQLAVAAAEDEGLKDWMTRYSLSTVNRLISNCNAFSAE